MPTPIGTVCPRCRGALTTEYARLGVAIRCPLCFQRVVPDILIGREIPPTGYQISYRDFLRLIEDPICRPSIAPLIDDWFAFTIEQTADDVFIRHDVVAIDSLWLHLQIQSNPTQQRELYNAAMTLWR